MVPRHRVTRQRAPGHVGLGPPVPEAARRSGGAVPRPPRTTGWCWAPMLPRGCLTPRRIGSNVCLRSEKGAQSFRSRERFERRSADHGDSAEVFSAGGGRVSSELVAPPLRPPIRRGLLLRSGPASGGRAPDAGSALRAVRRPGTGRGELTPPPRGRASPPRRRLPALGGSGLRDPLLPRRLAGGAARTSLGRADPGARCAGPGPEPGVPAPDWRDGHAGGAIRSTGG